MSLHSKQHVIMHVKLCKAWYWCSTSGVPWRQPHRRSGL